MNIYLSAHLVGGFSGGYLVARVKSIDYIQVGTVTAILAYIFEFIYNIVFEAAMTDIYAAVSLLIGGIIGAMFFRARIEREKDHVCKEARGTQSLRPNLRNKQ